MSRHLRSIVLMVVVLGIPASSPPVLQAQVGPPPTPGDWKFDVASVKRNRDGGEMGGVGMQRTGRFFATNATPMQIITWSYRLDAFRVAGGPAWAASERYDVVATTDPAQFGPSGPGLRIPRMVQNLMADRFKLAVHRETRPLPVYALVVARADGRLGPGLQKAMVDCAALQKAGTAPPPAPPGSAADFGTPPTCGIRGGAGLYAAGGVTLADFAEMLKSEADAPVLDRTQLTGPYNITLKWNPDPRNPTSDPSVPALFNALQEQLGLRLERRTEPIEVLVIDSIARPTDN